MLQDKLHVFTHLKCGSSQEKFDVWPRPKSYNASVIFGVPFERYFSDGGNVCLAVRGDFHF